MKTSEPNAHDAPGIFGRFCEHPANVRELHVQLTLIGRENKILHTANKVPFQQIVNE